MRSCCGDGPESRAIEREGCSAGWAAMRAGCATLECHGTATNSAECSAMTVSGPSLLSIARAAFVPQGLHAARTPAWPQQLCPVCCIVMRGLPGSTQCEPEAAGDAQAAEQSAVIPGLLNSKDSMAMRQRVRTDLIVNPKQSKDSPGRLSLLLAVSRSVRTDSPRRTASGVAGNGCW
jgi:hypothetical protein